MTIRKISSRIARRKHKMETRQCSQMCHRCQMHRHHQSRQDGSEGVVSGTGCVPLQEIEVDLFPGK